MSPVRVRIKTPNRDIKSVSSDRHRGMTKIDAKKIQESIPQTDRMRTERKRRDESLLGIAMNNFISAGSDKSEGGTNLSKRNSEVPKKKNPLEILKNMEERRRDSVEKWENKKKQLVEI